MQKQGERKKEEHFLTELADLEDLLEKKTKIYSRLLMDAALAKDMETLSMRHGQRKQAIDSLLGKEDKEDKE